jgi:hypothetical protein
MDIEGKPFFETMYADRGNVVDFLRAFAAMRNHPLWKEIGFEQDSLAWIARVWQEAAIAAVGNTRLRDACNHEAERYASLRQGLVDGMMERQEPGVVFLSDRSDWPHPKVLKGAIRALRHAQIGRLQ